MLYVLCVSSLDLNTCLVVLVVLPRGSCQDSSKGGAEETGYSGSHYIIGCVII